MHDAEVTLAPGIAPVTLAAAPLLVAAAAASLAAGLVHTATAGTHVGAPSLVRLFAVTAAVQVLWAGVVLVRPTRLVVAAGVPLNGACVAAWAVSRLWGLPWPAELRVVEAVGVPDVIAVVLGAGAFIASALALARPALAAPRRGRLPLSALLAGGAALALAVPGMAAPHAHGGSYDHGPSGEVVAGSSTVAAAGSHHDEAAGSGAAADPSTTGEAAPIISVDDERVTPAQRAAAVELIAASTAAMSRFSDTASVEAAGYLSIGDSVTGFEHFINIRYLADGVDLDPERVESIVFVVNPDGTKQLGSAMYILGLGQTMADAPDIAGPLTTWHDHQNLCWQGTRVVGVLDPDGTCPRGEFRATPPMLHVWITPQPCGPFAGIEGHGTDCSHSD